ncbi:aminoglycoside phosphotransferase [Brachybacterium vulturis]|uniref:Aminoglycoside phosphotransferase n=1 Tax=Brachybacterium vulturis TaxID=2017484 RepID=A0A291GNT2_9MICO|nr:phosphotransferase [Brachybacterium vulturis]ATG51614.1 aminoglycoside phosphotransferase [Brachybacterium vulturis]
MTGMPSVAPVLPAADLPVDLRRIELLCARLRPEEGVELEHIVWRIAKLPRAEGWDNVLWPVGSLRGRELVLRVARREVSRALLGREVTVLRRLRGLGIQLPMGLPTVLAMAEDAVLVEWIDGTSADVTEPRMRAGVAGALARMLATIHSGPAPEVGRNPVRGVPLITRAEAFARDLELADLPPARHERAQARWSAGLAAAPWRGRELLLHGDPHPGNVVVPESGARGPAALIDWGDTTRGDPASDLGGMLLHLPSDALLHAYRDTAAWTGIDDEEIWDALVARSWAWATRMALSLVTAYAPDDGLGAAGHRLLSS